MKKRKKPIFLVAFLVLLVAVVTAVNSNLLSSPKTVGDLQRQADEAAQAQKQQADLQQAKDKTTQVAAAKPPPDVRYVGDTTPKDDMANNIKAHPAVAPGSPLIEAPKDPMGKATTPDRASTQPNSAWYMQESGANVPHGK